MTETLKEARAIVESVRASRPGAYALARAVSLAARVEPALLRRARLELLPHLGAGDEADLWFSPLVQARSPLAIVFAPDVTELLRLELAEDHTTLGRVWDVIRRVHANSPPAILLEEEITYLALSAEPEAPERIRALLLSAACAMVEGDGRGLAQWALRALPRLPEGARNSEAAWALAVGAGARLGGRRILAGEAPDTISQSMLRWVLPAEHKQAEVGIRLLEAGVELSEPPASGAHVIRLPKTDPLLLEVSWGEGSEAETRRVTLRPGQTQLVETASPAGVSVSTPAGETYTIRRDYEFDVYIDLIDSPWAGQLTSRLQKEEWRDQPLKVAVFQMESMPVHPDMVGWSKEQLQGVADSFQAQLEYTAKRNRRASRKVVKEVREETLKNLGPRPQGASGDDDDPRLIRIYGGPAGLPPEFEKYVDVDFSDKSRFEESYRKLMALIKDEPYAEPNKRTGPVKVYLAYSHKDEKLKERLLSHLAPLRREGLIDVWHDREIDVGGDWGREIDDQLNSADLILALVSADFLNSKFVYEVEMRRAMERHAAREARVIPVLLRPCDWTRTPLAEIQALPAGGRPVTSWENTDEAFAKVAEGVRQAAEDVAGEKEAREARDAARTSVFVSHNAGDRTAAELLAALSRTLQAYNFDLFVDLERLQAGYAWRQELSGQMARADAAVVLLSRTALGSEWVRREVAILSQRRELDENFFLLPVLLEGVELRDAAERLGSPRLYEIQALRAEGSPEETARRIVQALTQFKAGAPGDPPHGGGLEKLVAERLSKVPDEVARRLLEGYGMTEESPRPSASPHEELARRMSWGGLFELETALEPLRHYLDESDARQIVDMVASFTVNPSAAEVIRRVVLRVEGPRVLFLNTIRPLVARLFIWRACGEWPPWTIIVGDGAAQDVYGDGETSSAVILGVERAIRGRFGFGRDRGARTLEAWLRDWKEPIILLFNFPGPSYKALDELRTLYPTLTLFMLTTRVPPREEIPDYAQLIYTNLDADEEEKIERAYESLRSLLGGGSLP